jgi:hypothetical protein
MAGVEAPLIVPWQACGRDKRGGRRRGAAGGAAWGGGHCRRRGMGALQGCPALLSALLPVHVKAAVCGSLLCVRGRKQEEGEEEKKRKRRKRKEKKKKI